MLDVVEWNQCIGCGACAFACDKGAVQLVDVRAVGIRPRFDAQACRACNQCLAFCPGHQVASPQPARRAGRAEHEIGPFLELWVGHAADPEIRYRASSGGVLSALSLFCLEHEGMRLVLHAGMDEEHPWRNKTHQSRTREDILTRTGSRYAPASPCDSLAAIEASDGPCVFVGKPCDCAAVSMLRRRRPSLERNLGLVLGFFCAGTPSTQGTLSLLETMHLQPEEVTRLRYRGEGWPGGFKVHFGTDGEHHFIPYRDAWRHLKNHSAFRCRLCPDGVGRLTDITCGDAWHVWRAGEANDGESVVIVRTARGRALLRRAMAAGAVELRPIDAAEILTAQDQLLEKRRHLFGRLLALRLLLIPTPRFSGFSLVRGWLGLPLRIKLKTVLATLKRLFLRRLWRRNKTLFSGHGREVV